MCQDIRTLVKDSLTFDLTVRPLSGALTASPRVRSDGGAKVKTSGNLGYFTLFNYHFMPLNRAIFGIFLSSPAPPLPGLYFPTSLSLSSWRTNEQRVPQYLSFCRVLLHNSTISPFLDSQEHRAQHFFCCPILATYRDYGWVSRPHSPARSITNETPCNFRVYRLTNTQP
jgi:hypothetical protein